MSDVRSMNDVRRFMRYILPGLAYAIELLIALIFSKDIDINQLKDFDYIGVVFGVFLASGAMGYIFSIIYFGTLWKYKYAPDYRPVFISLKNKTQIINQDEKIISVENLTKDDAKSLISLYWYHNIVESERIKGINPYVDRLLDITHGLGAFLIGTFFSIIPWIIIHTFWINKYKDLIILVCWAVLLYIIHLNYKTIQKKSETLSSSTILSELLNEYKKNQELVRIYLMKLN